MSNDSISNDGQIPVSASNWLNEVSINLNQEKLHEKFAIAYKCREEILDKHFGKPLDSKFLKSIKTELEKFANLNEGEDWNNSSLLLEQKEKPDEFLIIEIVSSRFINKSIPVEKRKRPTVDLSVSIIRYQIQKGDPKFDHGNNILHEDVIESVNFGKKGEDVLPLISVNNNPSRIVTPERQIAWSEGKDTSIQGKSIHDMEIEFLGLCNSQGVTKEDLIKLGNSSTDKYAIPEVYVGNVLGFDTALRVPRSDDTLTFNLIKEALESGGKLDSRKEVEDYKTKFVLDFERRQQN